MHTMEFVGTVRPGQQPWTDSWPGQLAAVRLYYENIASGWLEVAPLDPDTEAVAECRHASAFAGVDEMTEAMRWCDAVMDFERETVLQAWNQALGPECPICLEAIAPAAAHHCPQCPQQFHRQCFEPCSACPVCRQ
jgi:hypothetical protein